MAKFGRFLNSCLSQLHEYSHTYLGRFRVLTLITFLCASIIFAPHITVLIIASINAHRQFFFLATRENNLALDLALSDMFQRTMYSFHPVYGVSDWPLVILEPEVSIYNYIWAVGSSILLWMIDTVHPQHYIINSDTHLFANPGIWRFRF